MKADAVFEGGGVKGIAFIGALEVMERHGFAWQRIAGTSAGAIVAALVSAGYKSNELRPIFEKLDYLFFLERRGLGRLPIVGPLFELAVRKGIYRTDRLEKFIDELLRRKGIRTFGDLPKDALRIIASDITAGKMLVLPDDLVHFDLDPERFSVARAVRMSSSIPFFFQPARLYREEAPHFIVDGGLLSNYPVWLFDVPGIPRWPTIGFRLHDNKVDREAYRIRGLFSFTRQLVVTMLDAHDRLHVDRAHAVRTVFVNTLGVRTTQFQLSPDIRRRLYESGVLAATHFLEQWNFEQYIEVFRRQLSPTEKTGHLV
ncbi:patatin-like phospholipase family protein [Brevibacillus composti]|uniref:Patatin-like phospholipase family protein n=1 Tax=Brevibacillus composti TaxID=2796470 RepID=A0A7T5JMF0_9BACL|nr:patatin-like phospholipase family protein [Brevibacillus composti]QQE72915.1 patatin-like phospholipase family protein [Brevibacillus composti]QUO39993.1 patatin-like phospholipase family protein [Brevibacillus composti]